MRAFALIVLAASLPGCGTTPNSSVTSGSTSSESCTASAVGSPVAIDEATTLGFSAADVVALLNGEIAVEATDVTDDSVETHTISYSFTPDETAQVEERTVAAGAEGSCISGTTLAIAGTLNVEADDGWISGSGPVQVSAQAAEVASVWVDASFSVTPSTELASVAGRATSAPDDKAERCPEGEGGSRRQQCRPTRRHDSAAWPAPSQSHRLDSQVSEPVAAMALSAWVSWITRRGANLYSPQSP